MCREKNSEDGEKKLKNNSQVYVKVVHRKKNSEDGEKKVKKNSPAGNRTRVFRVTGGDTYHYTTEDYLVCVVLLSRVIGWCLEGNTTSGSTTPWRWREEERREGKKNSEDGEKKLKNNSQVYVKVVQRNKIVRMVKRK